MTRTPTMRKAASSLGAGVVLAVLVAALAPVAAAVAQAHAHRRDGRPVRGHRHDDAACRAARPCTSGATRDQRRPGDAEPGGPDPASSTQGDTVQITLHNQLGAGRQTALLFQGQAMVPDLTGVPPAAARSPTPSPPSRPGTYLYEAGLLPNAAASGGDGPLRSARSCARPTAGRPMTTPSPPSTTRRCWSSARSIRR